MAPPRRDRTRRPRRGAAPTARPTACRRRRPRCPAEQPVPGPASCPRALATVRTVERHLDEILAAVPQPDPIELAVLDAQGLLCAEEVVSQRALPAFDQAALDGYAARADDVAGRRRSRRRSSSRSWGRASPGAGTPSSIGPGLALKVAAGAMLPAGADVVVPAVWTDQGPVRVAVHAGPPAGSYVRRTGDDVAPGRPRRAGRHADRPRADQPAGRRRPGAGAGPAAAADRRPVRRHRAGRRRDRRRRPGSSSTSTATRWPRPPGTPAPRPTASGILPTGPAPARPRCWRASCCAATWCSSPARSPAAGSTWCRRRSPSSARCASGRSPCTRARRRASAGWAATTSR